MLNQVPVAVELAIYGYFAVVATIGLSLHARLLGHFRRNGYADDERSRESP